MTTERRLANDLPEILGDVAMGPYPDYIDDVLTTTAQVRQRPAWTFPERWIPMVDIVRQPVFLPRLPWRSIAMAAVLLALLLAAAAIYIGSQQQRVPAPFGPARNGVIAYEAGGDIYTADPVSGAATAIVSGSAEDVGPRFSRDGRLVAFERKVAGGAGQLYIARSDGSHLTLVTPEPITIQLATSGRSWEKYQFSPDGTALLIATMTGGYPTLTIAQTDGSGVRALDIGMPASEPSFRPPDGAEILFIGNEGMSRGLYVVDLDTLKVTELLKLEPDFDLAGPSWSPDGARIAYWSWGGPGEGLNAKTHVIAADGTGDRELPSPPGAVWNAHATWSNDGTRLFIARGYGDGMGDVRGVVIPADGRNFGVEVAQDVETECCAAWQWSPDDSTVLGRSTPLVGAPRQPIVIDVAAKQTRPAPWAVASDPTWQRLAP
jgi:Tol biopolymer transport system component